MASNKQLAANRQNARRSTGPRSSGGKARSRLNSWKHGLTAKTLVIVGEHADDFDGLRGELLEQHGPRSALEFELVERLAGILWRLRRVPFFEAAILDARHAQVAEDLRQEEEASRLRRWHGYQEREQDEGDEEEAGEEEEVTDWEASVHFGLALIKDGFGDALGRLARHETTLMNAFTKTLQVLLLLQENRDDNKREPVMIEAVAIQ
jgi:hypothetical protein